MGNCLTFEDDEDRCQYCNRRAVNNLVVIDGACEICRATHHVIVTESITHRPQFGEYQCSCGRQWASRRSWSGRYQICKRCRKYVYPRNQRHILSSDISHDRKNVQDHPKELCQMCIELGYYCGRMRSTIKN